MHVNKGKAYGRQGKAPKGVKFQHSRLLLPFPITIKTLPIQSEPVDIPMFICVIVILFYLICKMKRVTNQIMKESFHSKIISIDCTFFLLHNK